MAPRIIETWTDMAELVLNAIALQHEAERALQESMRQLLDGPAARAVSEAMAEEIVDRNETAQR